MKFFSSPKPKLKKSISAPSTSQTRRPHLLHAASDIQPSSTTSPTPLLRRQITTIELELALRRLGSSSDLSDILAEADPDGAGTVCLENLVAEEEELKLAFGVYDLNGDGKISPEELKEVMRLIGDESVSIEDCRRMIGGVDSDGDGFVCFRDFARMMAVGLEA